VPLVCFGVGEAGRNPFADPVASFKRTSFNQPAVPPAVSIAGSTAVIAVIGRAPCFSMMRNSTPVFS